MTMTPRCPRCGYDLHGAVASWTDACPMAGRCPECGVEFSWGPVFNPALGDVPGFVEHARTKLGFAASALRTWLWALLPWVFWRRVRVEGRTRPLRAWGWLVFLLLGSHALASTLACGSVFVWWLYFQRMSGQNPVSWPHYLAQWAHPFAHVSRLGGRLVDAEPIIFDFVPVVFAFMFHVAFALMLGFLTTTLGRAKVRIAHVQRAIVYGFSWLIALAVFRVIRNGVWLVQLLVDFEASATRGPFTLGSLNPWLLAACLEGWIALWWLVCFTRGWRIRHALLTWLLLGFAALLLSFIMVASTQDRSFYSFFAHVSGDTPSGFLDGGLRFIFNGAV